ncbi:hypothetical protein ACFSJY_04055 [Thalassotalea euphylliae]|uniref:hypothetical protein n=1 Tax=Thalassotalea euphylliae TaxID=1655234 RepID=UPI003628F8DD
MLERLKRKIKETLEAGKSDNTRGEGFLDTQVDGCDITCDIENTSCDTTCDIEKNIACDIENTICDIDDFESVHVTFEDGFPMPSNYYCDGVFNDRSFIKQCLASAPYNRDHLAKEYSMLYERVKNSEPVQHKKENAARRAANIWLRKEVKKQH